MNATSSPTSSYAVITLLCAERMGRREFNIKMEAGDKQILREGTCDYLGFSYYMTNAVKRKVAAVTRFPASKAASPTHTLKPPTGAGR